MHYIYDYFNWQIDQTYDLFFILQIKKLAKHTLDFK